MGEYIKYKSEIIKIGTCESLYYATYQKYVAALNANLLSNLENNSPPIEYAKPDSGFRFRFPFPDEDHLPLGDIAKHEFDRGVSLKIDARYKFETSIEDEKLLQTTTVIKITQQKLVHRQSDNKLCLALVYKDPTDNTSYRIEEDKEVKELLSQIIKHHVANESDPIKKSFYRIIAARILKGYRLEIQHNQLERKTRQHNYLPPENIISLKRKR